MLSSKQIVDTRLCNPTKETHKKEFRPTRNPTTRPSPLNKPDAKIKDNQFPERPCRKTD